MCTESGKPGFGGSEVNASVNSEGASNRGGRFHHDGPRLDAVNSL